MGPGMFDNLIVGLIGIGVAIGLCLAGLIWFLFWVFSHLTIAWI